MALRNSAQQAGALPFTIYLAEPRGFCAGVDRAILIVEKALELYGRPIYVKHEIVHNRHVVKRLEQLGAIFTEDLQTVPAGSRVVFSAHGVSPAVKKEAAERQLMVLDATCPLVTKVHNEAVRYGLEDYQIVLIGHHDHVEVVGTYGYAPKNITIVGSKEEVEGLRLDPAKKMAYLTQTTLSIDDTKEIIEKLLAKYPTMENPPKEDICYATTNRQNAVKAMAQKVPVMLVVGSASSSNTMRLLETAEKIIQRAYRVEDENDIEEKWLAGIESVGITAGASAPEEVVQRIIQAVLRLKGGKVERFLFIEENIQFPLPFAIRQLLKQTQTEHKLEGKL